MVMDKPIVDTPKPLQHSLRRSGIVGQELPTGATVCRTGQIRKLPGWPMAWLHSRSSLHSR